MEKLADRLKKEGVMVYSCDILEDVLIAEWYKQLLRSKDLFKVAGRPYWRLSSFFNLFQPPRVLLYTRDKKGIWCASWLSAWGDAVVLNGWTRRDRRGTALQLHVAQLMYDTAFEGTSLVIGMIKQESLLGFHYKMGYTLIGKLPNISNNEDVYILTLTKDDYKKGGLKNVFSRTGRSRTARKPRRVLASADGSGRVQGADTVAAGVHGTA